MSPTPTPKKNFWRQCALRFLRLTVPSRFLLVRGSSRRPAVYLTFDDGPIPEATPRILDALRQHSAKATFFVIGEQAARHPDLLRRIVAEGHALGGHSFLHRKPGQVTAPQLLEEVRQTDQLFQQTLGWTSRLFRPPFGKLTAHKLLRLWFAGRTVVLWNRDPKDFACDSGEQVLAWLQTHPPAAGDIVLLHDIPQTAEVLEQVIQMVKQAGLNLSALGRE